MASPTVQPITDPTADDLAPFHHLTDSDWPARRGYLVAEGTDAVRWLLESRWPTVAVLTKPSLLPVLEPGLQHQADAGVSVRVATTDQAGLSAVLGFPFKRGCVAVAARPTVPSLRDQLQQGWRPRRVAVCDAIHDPANLGAIARSVRCLGLDGLVLLPGCADPWYRRAIRTSVGHLFHVPIVSADDPVVAITDLQAAGMTVVAAHRGPGSRSVAPLVCPWAVVLGNEDRGVRPAVVDACDRRCHISMAAGVDSLNVAVAAGVMLHALRGDDAAAECSDAG